MGKIGLSLIAIITSICGLRPHDIAAQPLVRVGYSGTGVAKNLHKTIERAGCGKNAASTFGLFTLPAARPWHRPWSEGISTSLIPMFPQCSMLFRWEYSTTRG